MSLASTSQYYVTVDSQFRDIQKYPYDTDFGLTFKVPEGSGPYASGVPTPPSDNTQNSFFSPLQIDPDYISSNWKLTNGIITNFKQLSTGEAYICGLMDNTGQSFNITYKDQEFLTIYPYNYDINGAFLINFTENLTDGSVVFNWIVYLGRVSLDDNAITRATFDISQQENIYFMFDFSATEFSVKYSSNPAPWASPTVYYTVKNPTPSNNICIATLAFDTFGNPLYVNGHNFGYQLLASSTDDLLSTNDNGRFGVKVDISGNIYLNANTNPYQPTIYATPEPSAPSIDYKGTEQTTYLFTGNSTNYLLTHGNEDNTLTNLRIYNSTPSTGPLQYVSGNSFPLTNANEKSVSFAEDSTYVYIITLLEVTRLHKTTLVFDNTYVDMSGMYTTDPSDPLYCIWGYSQKTFITSKVLGSYLYITFAFYDTTPQFWFKTYKVNLSTAEFSSASLIRYYNPSPGSGIYSVDSVVYGGYIYVAVSNADQYPPDLNDPLLITNKTLIYKFDSSKTNTDPNAFTLYTEQTVTSGYAIPTFIIRSSRLYIVITTLNAGLWIYDVTTSTPSLITRSVLLYGNNKVYGFTTSTNYYLYTKNSILDWTDVNNLYLITDNYPLAPNNISTYLLHLDTNNNFLGFYINNVTSEKQLLKVQNVIKSTSISSYHYNSNIESSLNAKSVKAIDTLATSSNHFLFFITQNTFKAYGVVGANNINEYTVTNFPSDLTPGTYGFYCDVKAIEYVDSTYPYIAFVWDQSKIYIYTFNSMFGSILLAQFSSSGGSIYKVIPFLKDGFVYFYVLYYDNFTIERYKLTIELNVGTIVTDGSTFVDPDFGTCISGGDVYTYNSGKIYLFVYKNFLSTSKVYAIDNDEFIVGANLSLTNVVFFKRCSNIVAQDDGTVKIIQRNYDGYTTVIDITQPSIMSYVKFVSGWTNGYLGYESQYINYNNYDSAQYTLIHPISKKTISLQYSNQDSSGDPISNIQTYVTYIDILSNNNIKLSSPYPLKVIGGVTQIKGLIINQNVVAFYLRSDGDIYISDFSNPEFASIYYQRADDSYPAPTVTTYNNLNGIGLTFINKIDSLGNSIWLSSLGGDSNPYHSMNVNSSNIIIDPSLSYIYISGGWSKKIQTYNSYNTGSNLITSRDSSYNIFMSKIDIRDGSFLWLSPLIGDRDDYSERIQYISSLNQVCMVAHFSSTVLLIYQRQLSQAGGTFTNPNTVLSNISNSSTETSAVITFDTNGNYSWNTLLFSNEELRYVKLYDITIDDSTTSPTIQVIGVSNANTLQGLSSNKIEHQALYETSLNPLSQGYIFTYGYTLAGIYKYSNYTEYSPSLTNVKIDDIKSYGNINRVLYFPNYSQNTSFTGTLYSYNRDGTIGGITYIDPSNLNLRYSRLIAYKYDPTYTDTNGVNYSKIVFSSPTGSLPTGSLINNYLYILGSLPVYDLGYASMSVFAPTNALASNDTVLSKNFSIRNNFIDSNGKFNIILNQTIPINNLNRQNYYSSTGTPIESKDHYWAGSVSKSQLNSVALVGTDAGFDPTCVEIIYNLGTAIDTTTTYYIIFPYQNSNLTYTTKVVPVINVVYNSTSSRYNFYVSNANDLYINYTNTTKIGPYVYISTFNQSALYTLQFYPGSLNTDTYFKLSIQRVIIPNRRVRNSPYQGGTREISDFPYVYLQVYNANNNEVYDTNIVNISYNNNPDKDTRTLFTIQTPQSLTTSSSANYTTISTSNSSKIKFKQNYYNIRFRLIDPYQNVILFDNTPYKSTDITAFGTNVVDPRLMNMVVDMVFTPV